MSALLLDVSVLLAAHRDDHTLHDAVRPWLDRALAEPDGCWVPDTVWASFLRLATSARVFVEPTPREEAFAFLEAVLAQPTALRLPVGRRHLALLRRACDEADATGDLVPDAVLAAMALEHDCVVATLDRDFARFPSVRTVRPGPPSGPDPHGVRP